MAITFDTEKYLAKVNFTEAELDRLCVKKAEVIGVSSRQSVKILCEGVEYEDVPVWIHTDCGARHWYLKGLEAVEEGQEPPIAPTAAEYFKDAALMFPFPGGAYVKLGGSEFQTITPYVLVVFTVTDTATTPHGVINILENIVDNPNRDTYKTYRPFLRFRFRHTSSIGGGGILHSRTYLYDLIEERVARVPTWNFATESWELPFKNLESIEDIDVDKELDIFTSGAPHIPEARLRLTPLTAEHHGTTIYAIPGIPAIGKTGFDVNTNLAPYQNSWGVSTCNGETLDPGWSGTYSLYVRDVACNCGFGAIEYDWTFYQDQTFSAIITHYSPTMTNLTIYANMTVGRYKSFHNTAESKYIPSGGGCPCSYQSGFIQIKTSERFVVTLPESDPVEVLLEDAEISYVVISPSCPSNYFANDNISCGAQWVAEKSIAGKKWFEIGSTIKGNFFLSVDTVSYLQVATYTRYAEQPAGNTFNIENSVIENNIYRAAFDGYSGEGFLLCDPAMSYIASVVAEYHESLVDSNYFKNIEDARRANIGDGWEYYYMYPPETIKLEVTLQGLYFIPFNREIALLEES